MRCDECSEDIQPERMTKGELMKEVVRRADLPELENTASYGFKKEQFEELVKFLRAETAPSRSEMKPDDNRP